MHGETIKFGPLHVSSNITLILRRSNFITTDYNDTADNILVILDHSISFTVTIPYAVYIQFDLLMMSIILLETCRRLQHYMN